MYKEIDSVEDIIKQSKDKLVIVLKHSTACGMSAYGKSETDAFMEETGSDVYLVVVQTQRELSNQLAAQLGIRHESPQVLVIKKGTGQALNHYSITRDAIKSLL